MTTTTTLSTTVLHPPRRPRLYWACADALVLAARTLRHIWRIPEQLAFATLQPVVFVLLFRYVFGGAIHVGGASYVNYLMAGIFAQAMAFGAVNTGVGLAEDLQQGLIDRFRTLPMARSAVLVGRTLADLVRNLFVVLIMLLVGVLVGFRPAGSAVGWVGAVALLLLMSFAFSWVGAALGLLIRSAEAVQPAAMSWLFPLTFASSAFVPPASMPGWLRAFATHQPLTLVIDTTRALFLGRPVGAEGWQAVAWLAGILVAFAPLAVALYRRAATR